MSGGWSSPADDNDNDDGEGKEDTIRGSPITAIMVLMMFI